MCNGELESCHVGAPTAFKLCFRVCHQEGLGKDGLKFSGTHQLLVYTGDVSILAGSIHTIKKNVEALAVASKETGLEILSTGSYLEIRMQDKVTIRRLIITSLKGWKSSNIWDQP